mgnify:CR=1 FL=1
MNLIEQLIHGLDSRSSMESEQLAAKFASFLPKNTILCLHGDLGVGKTTFVRGLARAWEIGEPITSPTFNLYSIYRGTRQLVHLDAYRLGSSADLDALMIEDFFSEPWCFAIEWPERIAEAIPENAWHLHFNTTPEQVRRIQLKRDKH